MGLRDEIKPKLNKLAGLREFVEAQTNADEWHQVIMDTDYSTYSVAALLTKHGFPCDWNVVYRYRERHAR